jgi:hypothetical protein
VPDEDDGYAISYKVLPRGVPVRTSDGVYIGTVSEVLEASREQIFDGIMIDTPDGPRWVDAPEVARIAERAVTLTIDASGGDAAARERCQGRQGVQGRCAICQTTSAAWRRVEAEKVTCG